MTKDYGLGGKVAIVTGGAKGIGKAITLGLIECGCKVVIASRSKEQVESLANEIKQNGGDALPLAIDLMQTETIPGLIESTVGAYGRVDILINNAARSFLRPIMELREDGYDKVFITNVKAPFLLSREAAKVMKDQGGGKIINITTVGAVRGGAGMGVYHASKAALSMLTKCMAVEWAPYNINVNAVGPGLTKTAFSEPIWSNPEVEKQISSKIPKGRIALPEEVVGAVLFLCSEDSSFITGQSLYVDGGTLAA
jgi:NAD(P)-dependent dehydrogenase (short-subunit alcohol dehydrogenase family)